MALSHEAALCLSLINQSIYVIFHSTEFSYDDRRRQLGYLAGVSGIREPLCGSHFADPISVDGSIFMCGAMDKKKGRLPPEGKRPLKGIVSKPYLRRRRIKARPPRPRRAVEDGSGTTVPLSVMSSMFMPVFKAPLFRLKVKDFV